MDMNNHLMFFRRSGKCRGRHRHQSGWGTVAMLTASVTLGVASGAGGAPTTVKPSTPSVTVNKAALGTGGGKFCDALRMNLLDSMQADLQTAIVNGDTAKIKAYYEKSAAMIPKLIAEAPSELTSDVTLSMKRSLVMMDALKKVGYDIRKVDAKVAAGMGRNTAAETAAGSSPKLSRRTSQNTGSRPWLRIGSTVQIGHVGGKITSSPIAKSTPDIATPTAAAPDDTANA